MATVIYIDRVTTTVETVPVDVSGLGDDTGLFDREVDMAIKLLRDGALPFEPSATSTEVEFKFGDVQEEADFARIAREERLLAGES